jgi:hypothetical protein
MKLASSEFCAVVELHKRLSHAIKFMKLLSNGKPNVDFGPENLAATGLYSDTQCMVLWLQECSC